eukprot:PhM_4_TR106/c0_g1_i2/m.20882
MPSHPCAICCTVFSSIACVLLAMFGLMFSHRNISLTVRAHKASPVWDMDEKARTCFTAAAVYFALLLISLVAIGVGRVKDAASGIASSTTTISSLEALLILTRLRRARGYHLADGDGHHHMEMNDVFELSTPLMAGSRHGDVS